MSKKSHLLCVDDDVKIIELLNIYLEGKGFEVTTCPSASEASELTSLFLYDLIILDIMMPNISGIDFLRDFRIKDKNTPVLMLTANNQITKKGDSYDSGCDDYLIKPFEPDELLMRIKKLLNPRLNKNKVNKVAYFGEYIFDVATKVLKNKDNVINLTSTEITIIEFLVKNINIEVSREEIAKTLGESINLRSIDVTITRLRKKLIASNNDSILRTIRGKGYMLVSEYE
jgi:two-component system phosphate regulon response regulator OmpR